eukprot:m.87903 g.87903  ORF g.87903 m.87903 type:complete len:97 (+) comp11596_c0_seq2:1679-1969(+)
MWEGWLFQTKGGREADKSHARMTDRCNHDSPEGAVVAAVDSANGHLKRAMLAGAHTTKGINNSDHTMDSTMAMDIAYPTDIVRWANLGRIKAFAII